MQLQFNAQQVPPSQPFEPIPEAWYPNIIKSTEPNKVRGSDTKWYVKVEHEIIDGPFKGRKVYNNLNLGNDNQQAVDIAYRDLSALCHVTGRFVINDTQDLCNIPFQIKVVVDGANNAIKGYKDMQGNDPGKSGAQQGTGQPVQQQPVQQQPQGQWGPQGGGAQQQQPAATSFQPQGSGQWGNNNNANAGQQQQPAAGGGQWGNGQQTQPAAPQGGNGQQQPGGGWQSQGGGAPAGGAAPWMTQR